MTAHSSTAHASAGRIERVVIKVGSAAIAPVRAGTPTLDPEAIGRLANHIAELRRAHAEVVLVSSGAIPCGLSSLGLTAMPKAIVDRQAAAAIGQPRLMNAYTHALHAHGLTPAQLLLTAADLDHRQRFVNAHRTADALLERGLIPIVNENDTVSFEEIRFGDNDRLAALTACLVGADALVILSVAGGLRADRGSGPLIPVVHAVADARAHVADTTSAVGTGGMTTKLDSADIATRAGIPVLLAGPAADVPALLGLADRPVPPHTRFEPAPGTSTIPKRKAWLAYAAAPRGSITIDHGAAHALRTRNASVLPAGLVEVSGDFARGDLIEVHTHPNTHPDPGDIARATKPRLIARGLASYPAAELRQLLGKRTADIAATLGYHYSDEAIHRDDLVIL